VKVESYVKNWGMTIPYQGKNSNTFPS